MSCLKGKNEKKDGKWTCKKCGARSDKKGHVCKPKKSS